VPAAAEGAAAGVADGVGVAAGVAARVGVGEEDGVAAGSVQLEEPGADTRPLAQGRHAAALVAVPAA